MSVWIVFSRNDKAGSRLISWGSAKKTDIKKVPSHFSYCFKETYVLESRMTTGVRADEWENFKSKNDIIAIFDVSEIVKLNYGKWYKYYKHLYKPIMGKAYDKAALIYLGWKVFLWKVFNRPIPKTNRKNNPNKYFCVEVFQELFGEDLSAVTPYVLMAKCRGRFKRVL